MAAEYDTGWLLHSRPYRDTSVIVDLLTHNNGRVSAVARGVNGGGKSATKKRAQLRPFTPLHVSWQGRSALKTLMQIDGVGSLNLSGYHLYAGLYLNELLQRVLPEFEACTEIVAEYGIVLEKLRKTEPIEPSLRRFEITLLRELGYELDFTRDNCGQALRADSLYRLDNECGLRVASDLELVDCPKELLPGAQLLKIAANQFDAESLTVAKRVCRKALMPLVGSKPLRSRELFAAAVR